MTWFQRTLNSSVGGKYVVAITGLGLVGFLLAHLAGNLLIFVGPEAMYEYAKGLRQYPALLWIMRGGLLLMTMLHVSFAIKANLRNKAARPIPYASKVFIKASLPSRTMVLTGLLVMAYVAFHLAHFTFRVTSEQIGTYEPFDCYHMVIASFQDPLVACTYIAAMIVLGFHLTHGVSSLFQSLGINHDKYNPALRALGPIVGIVIPAIYISIPVSILLGIVR